jgi:hypothetical protein
MIFRNEQLPLGAQSTINEFGTLGTNTTLVSSNFKPTSRELVTVTQLAAASLANEWIYIAPWQCQVVAVRCNFTVTSTSGTLNIVKVTADAIAPSTADNGTTVRNIVTSPLSLSGTANTRVNGVISSAAGNPSVLNAGDMLAYQLAGTLTGLAGMTFQVELAQIG